MAEKDFEKLLTDAETEARKKSGEELDRSILALADTALLYKKDEAAQTLLEKTQTTATLERLGDLSAAQEAMGQGGGAVQGGVGKGQTAGIGAVPVRPGVDQERQGGGRQEADGPVALAAAGR